MHSQKIERIQKEVQERIRDKRPIQIFKGGVSHFVPLPNDPRRKNAPIDISDLNQVIDIDTRNKTCTAEPGVTFVDCVRETLKHGLIPTVVPELEGITLGGAVAGCSVESMSYKYGGFHDSCLEYELITGDGRLITLSETQDKLAFNMVHGSYGTLGVLTRLKFKLVEAKPFVKLTYRHFKTAKEFYQEMLERCKKGDFEFVDGIIHSKTHFTLVLGNFSSDAPYVSNYRLTKIFYKSTATRQEDYLTTLDYVFRYDTECHWLTKTVPGLENPLVRLAIGKFVLGSTNLIRWSKRLEKILQLKKRPDVVVDVFIPSERFDEFYAWYEKDFDFYPLWVIPYSIPKMYPWVNDTHAGKMKSQLFIDCAVYGKRNSEDSIDYSKLLEDKTFELGGIKTLISRNHYTRERFWQVYNEKNYGSVKAKLDPNSVFPDLFKKFGSVN